MELTIIPRGGGTATPAAPFPLTWRSAVINTEKLEAMSEVECAACPGLEQEVATVVWTEKPAWSRSAWPMRRRSGALFCRGSHQRRGQCIGGNIAMNAGGKRPCCGARRWTTWERWRMVTPDAQWLEVTRLNHNLGKIHDASCQL